MSSSRSSRESRGGKKDKPAEVKKGKTAQRSVQRMIESLESHRINRMTELVRMERIAATCDNEGDAAAFQGPMTEAWRYYVNSNQFLTELRGLTQNYPFSADVISDAQGRVLGDPDSNRSWNMAWLCLQKMVGDNLLSTYSFLEATKPEMWGGREPSAEEVDQLARCFEFEWNSAVSTMLRHWPVAPTWY